MRVVKKSSDEAHQEATHGYVAPAPRRKSVGDYAALTVATWGVGFLPLAPGTWGSLVGVGIYLSCGWLVELSLQHDTARGFYQSPLSLHLISKATLLIVIAAITTTGTWAASRAESLLARKDPGAVVVDEVAGQLIAFLFVPWGAGAWFIVAGFVAFRLFDIWKPYPIRRLEVLEGGLGIMADDVLAGLFAAALMSLLTSIYILT